MRAHLHCPVVLPLWEVSGTLYIDTGSMVDHKVVLGAGEE